MSRAVAWPMLTAESGIDHYFKEIQRFPMLDPQQEYMLAKRWSPRSPRAIAATVCRSLTLSRKAMSA
jgi:RNA polymerase sigma-32 factor